MSRGGRLAGKSMGKVDVSALWGSREQWAIQTMWRED
jgi:hypothetical protein